MLRAILDKLVTGKQKAVVGGASGGILSLLSMVGVSGQLTVKEVVFAVVTWVVAHVFVYFKVNRG